ncbi:MAG: hypothetical protein KAT77_04075 [Nanoarchaeota archaeon]|nr:hypothetical protein [Nanoarchaeota archaeon]
MFKFLKRLFEEKEVEETVEQDKLLFWFDNKVKEKLEKVDNDIIILFDGVESRKRVILERLEALETVEIKDAEKIEDRIKNVVQGHRTNYVRAMSIFLSEVQVPKQRTLSEAMKFNSLLREKLDELGKSTAKSYAASQHLFFDAVQQVVKGLKGLNDLVVNFDKVVEKNKLKDLEMIRMTVDLLYRNMSEKERLSGELKEKKEKLMELQLNKQNKTNEVESLEQSDDYRKYLELKDEKENLESQVRENQSKFLQIFAQLERSLRKYEHVALENRNLIRDYLENPIDAFFKDESLVFLKIVAGVRKNLESGIDLKESKLEKTMEVIDSVNESKLKEIKEKHNQLMEEKSIVAKKIDNNYIYGKLSDLKYRLEHVDVQIADSEQEVKELEEFLEKIDLDKIKSGIKEKVFEVFRVKLLIS